MKNLFYKILSVFFMLGVSVNVFSDPSGLKILKGNSLSQHGIIWTFDRIVYSGQYANGDYWIVDPGQGIKLVSIYPPSLKDGGRVINGSMLNPKPNSPQAFDSSINVLEFRESSNVARPNLKQISAENPVLLRAGDSLVSTISRPEAGVRPQVADAAVLTIVSEPPEQGAFRPPYSGSGSYKNIDFNISQLRWELLPNLSKTPRTPDINTVADYFERPWIDFLGGWNGRYIHPLNNMPDYGREIATEVSIGALMLMLDFSEEEKKDLLIRYIQFGIDSWGVIKAGGNNNWMPDGGHSGGRKWPIVFAGLMLNDSEMMNIGRGDGSSTAYFGEDSQTFIVSQTEVNVTNSPAWDPDSRSTHRQRYNSAHIGMPEWGVRHATNNTRDDAAWDTPYRRTAAIGWPGYALAARLMGAMDEWNHPAFFSYVDRFMTIRRGLPYGGFPAVNQQPSSSVIDDNFIEEMWDQYR